MGCQPEQTWRFLGAESDSPAVMMPVEGTGSTVMFWVLWGGCRCDALPACPPPSDLEPAEGMVRRAV